MNVLLICNAGLSTSLVAQDIEKEMAKRSLECTVNAAGIDAMGNVINRVDVDVILLAPQVKFLRKDVEKNLTRLGKSSIPMVDIPSMDYGRRNAKNIVSKMLAEMGK